MIVYGTCMNFCLGDVSNVIYGGTGFTGGSPAGGWVAANILDPTVPNREFRAYAVSSVLTVPQPPPVPLLPPTGLAVLLLTLTLAGLALSRRRQGEG